MTDVFIGRQPIFDRYLKVYAYELLFRRSDEDESHFVDGNQATSQVILNTFLDIGLDEIVGQKRAFINLTRDFLVEDNPLPFPKDRVVLEILEDVKVDSAVVAAVKRFKEQGHTIALDDFVFKKEWLPLVKVADIIKIDVLAYEREKIRVLVEKLRNYPCKLLAEKIETHEDYEYFQLIGFDLFQGFFLSRPVIVKGQRIPANKINTLQLMAKLNDPDVSVEELDTIISRDVSLSFKMLRYINSAFFALPREVESIRQAIVLLGLKSVKRWATLMAMSEVDDKPHELFTISLTRARLCELMAEYTGQPNPEMYFTMGLFSTLDALMDSPIDEVLSSLPLAPELQAALTRHEGTPGAYLKAVKSYERWQWRSETPLPLEPPVMQKLYLESLSWSLRALAGVA